MTKIPIILMLKKGYHKKIARAQDIIVEEMGKTLNRAVLHGGTAIWRCYQGNRFSEDIDVYIPRNVDKISSFFMSLEKKGFKQTYEYWKEVGEDIEIWILEENDNT